MRLRASVRCAGGRPASRASDLRPTSGRRRAILGGDARARAPRDNSAARAALTGPRRTPACAGRSASAAGGADPRIHPRRVFTPLPAHKVADRWQIAEADLPGAPGHPQQVAARAAALETAVAAALAPHVQPARSRVWTVQRMRALLTRRAPHAARSNDTQRFPRDHRRR